MKPCDRCPFCRGRGRALVSMGWGTLDLGRCVPCAGTGEIVLMKIRTGNDSPEHRLKTVRTTVVGQDVSDEAEKRRTRETSALSPVVIGLPRRFANALPATRPDDRRFSTPGTTS